MPIAVVVGVAVVAMLLIYAGPGGSPDRLAPAARWISDERMRAGYGTPLNETLLSKMRSSGMNALVWAVGYFDGNDPEWVEQVRGKARMCEEAGIRLFISIFYFTRDAGRPVEARRYVTASGEEKAAPCPLDEAYWREAILVQAQAVAELAKEVPLAGFLLDTEMYNSESAHIYSNNGCFCDECFRGFMAKRSERPPADRGERMGWLKEKGLLNGYYEYLRRRVASLSSEVREKIRLNNPDLLLGFLLYDHNWYYRGLAEGLGTPSLPALVMDESTYGVGWGPLGMQMAEYFPSLGYHVFYLPGLWLAFLSPNRIRSEAYHCGANAAGYWIFPFDSISADPSSLSGDFVLNGSQEDYWEAFRAAGSELDRKLQDENYASSIPYISKEDRSISFRMVEGQRAIEIVNDAFVARANLKVAINGKVVATLGRIDIKSASAPIPYEPDFTGSSGIYGQQGLNSVAVREKDGTIHNLLGETPSSAFD